ncbi:hypothetical protein [Agromyces mediolanus]|uniref:hypothetical protein n=1 Tax=Agromyces mediolanus TaxID=41986 RepID=UPI001E5C81E3|nr:hypothetical protein [Agromyces mediolanus]MCD1573043.1 hypothetical protein [Agromyces mediolanus]
MFKRLAGACAIAALITAGAAAPAVATTPTNTDAAAEQLELLENVLVELDPATGTIVSIRPNRGSAARISPVGPGCTTASVCLNPASGSIYYGFTDPGSLGGSWASRASWRTGSWTAQLQWRWAGSTVTGPALGPGSSSSWGGSAVTVTNVRIY